MEKGESGPLTRFLTAAFIPSRQCRSLRGYMRANTRLALHLKSPLDVVVLTVARLSSLFPRLALPPPPPPPPLPPACSNTPPKIGTEAAAPSETTTAAEPRTDALGPSSGPNHAPRLGLSLLGKFLLVKGNLNNFVCEIIDLFDLLFYLSGGIARPQIAVALAVLSSPRSPFALA